MNKQNKRKKEEAVQEENRPKIITCHVMVPNYHKNAESTLDFEWPEFTKEADRIKAYSQRFAGMSLVESFNQTYGMQLKEQEVQDNPRSFRVGEIIEVVIATVSKGSVTFSNINSKETIICKNNLYRYPNFKNAAGKKLQAKVVDVNKQRATVTLDVIQPYIQQWLQAQADNIADQYDVTEDRSITVHNLRPAKSVGNKPGGFIGKVLVDTLTDLLGEPYYIDAFVPGSQIVLNIENDFARWIGQDVKAFVSNINFKPSDLNQKQLICSVKNKLMFEGHQNLIALYNSYCDQSAEWNEFKKMVHDGIVTGPINSNKKCGVFVEIPSLHVTGMISLNEKDLVKYKNNQPVKVNITGFESMMTYDENGQKVHDIPYTKEGNILTRCILKPILKLV